MKNNNSISVDKSIQSQSQVERFSLELGVLKEMKNNNSISVDKSIQSQSQVERFSLERGIQDFNRAYSEDLTFNEVLNEVKRRIELDCFEANGRSSAEDICLIITEVLKLPCDALVRVEGNNLPAEIVQAIYRRLTHEHVELVVENFGRAAYEIKHKKTYLRTALYNSVFEFNAHYENAINKDFPEFVKTPFGKRRGG